MSRYYSDTMNRIVWNCSWVKTSFGMGSSFTDALFDSNVDSDATRKWHRGGL